MKNHKKKRGVNPNSRQQKVLALMKKTGGIDTQTARLKFGIDRLNNYIAELRGQGHNIVRRYHNGHKKWFYALEGKVSTSRPVNRRPVASLDNPTPCASCPPRKKTKKPTKGIKVTISSQRIIHGLVGDLPEQRHALNCAISRLKEGREPTAEQKRIIEGMIGVKFVPADQELSQLDKMTAERYERLLEAQTIFNLKAQARGHNAKKLIKLAFVTLIVSWLFFSALSFFGVLN